MADDIVNTSDAVNSTNKEFLASPLPDGGIVTQASEKQLPNNDPKLQPLTLKVGSPAEEP